ncbi:MAG: hypothetical protein WBX25_15970 [Rhodomicrobium sp.]
MRLFIFIAGLFAALTFSALAQITLPPARQPNSIVTVLSDELSEPASPASKILSELSVTLDKEGEVRLLSASGYGGPANARDLLQLRGADLAIINNDVLAHLDLANALPEARRKIRLVAPLLQQSVLLFAKKDFKSIAELRGRKIAVPADRPSRGVTAKTIFGLMKIEAKFVELTVKDLARRSNELDALVIYEQDLPGLQSWGITPATHQILPIPAVGPLAAVYIPKKSTNLVSGFGPPGSFETVQVETLLAAFDWSPKQGRYADVASFVSKFFALLPQFRANFPRSPFSKIDVKLNAPGWKRYGPAEALAVAAPAPTVKDVINIEEAPAADTLRIVAVERPPLTNSHGKDGGVALKILTAAMGGAGIPFSVQWVQSERALLDALVTNKTADAGIFWETTNCDAPSNQSEMQAELCDHAVQTEPVMQAVVAVFTRLDMPLDPKAADAPQSRTLCIPPSQSLPEDLIAEIPWLKGASLKKLRPKTLIDCLAALDAREADAVIAVEPEARFTIERLKLAASFQVSQRPGLTTGLHAVVAKDNPRQAQLVQSINAALAKFRASNQYSAVIASHLADLTGSAPK